MLIKLISLREQCGACPTHYTGETEEGHFFDAYLRNGYMKIEVENIPIVSFNPPELDGVCRFEDFKHYARINGYYIDDSEAEWSSELEDTEKMIEELYKDTVWVKFIRDFESKSAGKTYKKDERYTASIDLAETLVSTGLAIIDDESYLRKKQKQS